MSLEDFKKKLAGNKTTGTGSGKLTLGGLKKPLGTSINTGSNITNKFQKREQSVLDRTYETREERSKMGGVGKSIFNPEVMNQFNITEFDTMKNVGDRFVEIMPISYIPSVPYYKEVPVHYGCGFSNDAYICMLRFASNPCFRCEEQQRRYKALPTRVAGTAVPNEIKNLYPGDRITYLLWERTKELINGEPPDYRFQIWAASKKKVHSEIQAKVRDKIQKVTLDISDVTPGGEGRTISFTIEKQGNWPTYKAFDLNIRQSPIPNEILEQLDIIVSEAQKAGYTNAIDMFLYLPTYEEVKESMATETLKNDFPAEDSTGTGDQSIQSFANQSTGTTGVNESELIAELEKIQTELMGKNALAFKMWCNQNGYGEIANMPQEDAVNVIIDKLYTEAMEG